MKMTLIQLQAAVIAALVASGAKQKTAESTTLALNAQDLLAKAKELNIDCDEITEEPVAETDTVDAVGFNQPKIASVIGKFRKVRTFPVLDDQKEPVLDKNGEPRMVSVIDIQPIDGDVFPIFIQPKQLVGFDLNIGKFVKIDYEIRRAHVTQYKTDSGEIKFHGKESDPRGKVEYAFSTGTEYSERAAAMSHVQSLPVEERGSAIQAILAFRDFD